MHGASTSAAGFSHAPHDLAALQAGVKQRAAAQRQAASPSPRATSSPATASPAANPSPTAAVRSSRSTRVPPAVDKHMRSLAGDTVHVLYTSNGSPYQNIQGRIM